MTLATLHMKQDKKIHWSNFCNRLIDSCNHSDIAMFHIVEYLVSLIYPSYEMSHSHSLWTIDYGHRLWPIDYGPYYMGFTRAVQMLDLRPSKFRTNFILNEFQIKIPFFFHFKIFTREIQDLSCKLGWIV